ncbi:hypothetical protein CASFOL_003070 [Castilleja foliolosa]|uniref:Uncharacterized protein n=1 Tax=Castilleja foliolosa TaxID=1961234 RepID=A0ABD3EJZ3_9LAMI
MARMYSLFNDLHSGKSTWAVKVRVIRTYLQPKFEYPKGIEKSEMILHDEALEISTSEHSMEGEDKEVINKDTHNTTIDEAHQNSEVGDTQS